MREHIGRSPPTEGVFIFRGQPTIVFLTVCAERREPALANSRVHGALIDAWRVANAWHVGYYVVMPDHVHLFYAPNNDECSIERWIAFLETSVPSARRAGFTETSIARLPPSSSPR